MALRADDVDIGRDRALVESFQAGDPAAFGQLYRTYYDRLERFCYRRLGDRSEAEEVAQEAFVRALRAMPNLAGERRFYPWVTVIASRLCVDTHRRLSRTSPAEVIDLGPVDGGQDAIVEQADLELLRAALDRLDPRHREVLRLREQEGWSYQHIADHFGITLGAVETLLFRARRALQREFRAVAGGALAGAPVVGVLLRRVAALRARIGIEGRPDLTPIVCNLAMAAGMATAVALGSGAAAGHAERHRAVAPVAAAPIAPPGTAAGAVTHPSSSTAAAPSAPVSPPTTAAVATPRPAAGVVPPAVRTLVDPQVTDYESERRVAASAPVYVDVPGVGNVGADPKAAVDRASNIVTTGKPLASQQLPQKDTP